MLPGQDGWQAPVVFSLIVFGSKFSHVGVIKGHKDRLLSNARLSGLVVNLRCIDRSCELGCCLVALLVREHEVFDGPCQLRRHYSCRVLLAILCEQELAKTNRCWDLTLQAKLDQVKSIEGGETRVRLSVLAIDEVLATKMHLVSVSHHCDLYVIRYLSIITLS